ncbi:hybrid sensor histidine kinase/response regulator [Terriglobus sp. TAA 43]|uniref:hybrid sensor histidine kinase/response regulator n=1 Tax=Terriglobus sp. TAA 43 TaxID=278961 RepID=UPI0006475999|nr:hybrid sensor histidine kinase/response regulator [Terriglobus sp. TAA 43]
MPTPELEPRRISLLLVEDNQDDAALLERFLRRNGFAPSVMRVETAAEMSAAIAAQRPDVVIADYNLPSFSGPEALDLVRQTGIDLPFVMMSGAISEETAVESMRRGAQDYVTKQNLARLIPVLERELREAEARRSRVAAERALELSEMRFHRLVDAMPLGLLIGQSSGRITYANDAVIRLLGYGEIELMTGKISLTDIFPGLQKSFAALNSDEMKEPFEFVCLTASGEQMETLVALTFLDREGVNRTEENREIAVFIADLSHQKKSEEVLRRTEKLAVAGRLAASIAHEINNPLAAITNCLYLVQQSQMDEMGRSYLEMAQKELDRVAQITVQTLRFHRQSSRPVHTEPGELIETVVALFESRIRRQGITITKRFRSKEPLFAYEGEVRQVIVNLLGNAIDAMPTGGRLVIRTAEANDQVTGTKGLILTISDTGSGMDQETIEHLFEPFFSTKGVTGTGLGLWVSKEIVDRHHGKIHVRSHKAHEEQLGGTTFRIFLPFGGVPASALDGKATDSAERSDVRTGIVA